MFSISILLFIIIILVFRVLGIFFSLNIWPSLMRCTLWRAIRRKVLSSLHREGSQFFFAFGFLLITPFVFSAFPAVSSRTVAPLY